MRRGGFAAQERGLFEEADRAVKGEVSVVGIPHAFPDGRIDWLFDPTAKKGPFNPEWMWQLNRMYFWSALAEAYSATGDEKYARAFVRQFSDWLAQTGGVPPKRDFNRVGSPWRTIEEGLRLAYSWDAAWHAFSKSPSFCGKAREDFVNSAHAQARHLLAHSTKPEIVSGRLEPTPAGWYFGRIGAAPDVRPATTLFVKFPPMNSLNALTRLRATPSVLDELAEVDGE